jgi:hypothetical protein
MAKSASKSSKKASAKKASSKKKGGPIIALYAVPIKHCAATGNLRDMKNMAAKARKHISDVQAALAKLEQSIAKLS